jgi:hypothetical protein
MIGAAVQQEIATSESSWVPLNKIGIAHSFESKICGSDHAKRSDLRDFHYALDGQLLLTRHYTF